MRLLVCGSRIIEDTEKNREIISSKINEYLDDCISNDENLVIITGGARGVDTIAEEIAIELYTSNKDVSSEVYYADWNTYSVSAGPIRNRQMLESPAHKVLAFIKGESKGTYNCIKQAKLLGIETDIVYL